MTELECPVSRTSRQWVINGRPNGRPLEDSDFKMTEGPTRPPEDGEVLVRTLFLGMSPGTKGWMENVANYVAPTQLGDVMPGDAVGEVVESKAEGFAAGDKVHGQIGWREYATLPAAGLRKVADDEFLSANLCVLGSAGLTAFFGMLRIGKPFPGDVVVITGAAGAVGIVAGQIAKMAGCHVVGIAGGERKCRALVDQLGFDAAIDYKGDDLAGQLAKHIPGEIDVLWDNVGGPLLNDLMAKIALHARVVICGGITRYETDKMPAGPENYFNLVFKRAEMKGLLVYDYAAEFEWARGRMTQWMRDGRLKRLEEVEQGFENAPRAMMGVFKGHNLGKQIVKIA